MLVLYFYHKYAYIYCTYQFWYYNLIGNIYYSAEVSLCCANEEQRSTLASRNFTEYCRKLLPD